MSELVTYLLGALVGVAIGAMITMTICLHHGPDEIVVQKVNFMEGSQYCQRIYAQYEKDEPNKLLNVSCYDVESERPGINEPFLITR